MDPLYDTIGLNYADLRRPDRRIARRIDAALGDAKTVLNVGAGTGSYEPEGRTVTALEPSAAMNAQRPASSTTVMQGRAEDLPFDNNAFDASMAVLTVHHWSDQQKGAQEMRRVTRDRVVFLTFDPAFRGFWLADYVPQLVTLDDGQMPSLADYGQWLGAVDISPLALPHDCEDGFLMAYWRRPAAYLDSRVRAAMSSFWALGDVTEEMNRLQADLESGEWNRRYGHLLELDEWDGGYRLVVTR